MSLPGVLRLKLIEERAEARLPHIRASVDAPHRDRQIGDPRTGLAGYLEAMIVWELRPAEDHEPNQFVRQVQVGLAGRPQVGVRAEQTRP